MTKAGFVALIGRPNSGKSTFLNLALKEKIAIQSAKANATRKRLKAIVSYKNNQIILVDTPGIHEKERLLNKFMLDEAFKAMNDCDFIAFLAPVTDSLKNYEKFLELAKNKKHIVLLTKTDMVLRQDLLLKLKEYDKYKKEFLEIIPVSLKKNKDINIVLDCLSKYLPYSEYLYDNDYITTENLRDIYKEFIREAIFDNLSDELPYSSDVLILKVEEKEKIDIIRADIIVEKSSQRKILVGKDGATIKRIGKSARRSIEDLLGKKVYLELFVNVKKNWTKDKKELKLLGYEL